MRSLVALLCLLPLGVLPSAHAQDPDFAIHEELRTVLREVQAAINAGQYERMLASGELESIAADAPDAAALRRGRLIGSIGLTVGLVMVGIIMLAVLK